MQRDAGDTWTVDLEEAGAWLREQARGQGLRLEGPIEQVHRRPWSVVLRAGSAQGALYLKAVAPALRHEVPLSAALAQAAPGALPALLAADAGRGWMLMREGGQRLREALRAEGTPQRWERVLAEYAEVQRRASRLLDGLIGRGLPDRRPRALPALLERLLSDEEALGIGAADGLTLEEVGRLRALLPALARLAEALAAVGVADSVHHGDLHDGNIFIEGGRAVFFDWGDASAAHPFVSLRTTWVSVENTLGLEPGDAWFGRLREAYLEAWSEAAPRAALRQAFALSERLAPIVSALSWDHVVSSLAPAARRDYAHAVPSLLRETLELAGEG